MAQNNAINAPKPFSVANGGTGAQTLTQNGVLLGNGTNAVSATAAMTDGQLLIGSTGNAPVPATLTAGLGIAITPAAGAITIAATGTVPFVDQTTTSVTMAANTGYVANNAALVTLTIPAVVPFGTIFRVIGHGAGGWLVQANTGQTINMGIVSSTAAGSAASSQRYDCMTLICTVADTTFTAIAEQGNIDLL